jgi:hypothetical protein
VEASEGEVTGRDIKESVGLSLLRVMTFPASSDRSSMLSKSERSSMEPAFERTSLVDDEAVVRESFEGA